MKKIKLFAFIAFSSMLAVSCSSDGDGGGSVDATEYFNYTTNGVEKDITAWQAYRSEDSFEVMGTNPDGTSMYFDFDSHGNLARAGSTPANDSPDPWMNSFQNYTSHYFNFDIVAIDAANQMIKVNYSGKLYEDEYDIDSAFSTVSGSFNVHYQIAVPQVANMHFTAKLGSNDWYGVSGSMSVYGFSDTHLWQTSGDEYQFDLNFNSDNLTTGTFAFTGASTANRVVLSKYDTTTNEYVDYVCTGSLTISDITDYGWTAKILTGTFNLTAVNGSSTIQVTNGSFKTVYQP